MTKDDIQKQALDSWIDKGCSGVVVMTMGSGKSKLGIDAINQCNPKRILITSPRTNLKESWLKEFRTWGFETLKDINNLDTFHIKGNFGSNYRTYTVDLVNIQTCYKWYREVVNKYDLIIIDEAHLVISQEYSSIVVKAL